MSDAPAELSFDIADRYAVVAEIGRGGFAVVYRARDRVLERDVAIKILRADSLPPSALRRFTLELQVTAKLEHPNILHVYDTGTWEGRPYYVMEYVRGQTLETRLSTEGVLAMLTPDMFADRVARSPLGRLGETQDIAETALWLASDRSGFINGQSIAVDGGLGHAFMS